MTQNLSQMKILLLTSKNKKFEVWCQKLSQLSLFSNAIMNGLISMRWQLNQNMKSYKKTFAVQLLKQQHAKLKLKKSVKEKSNLLVNARPSCLKLNVNAKNKLNLKDNVKLKEKHSN